MIRDLDGPRPRIVVTTDGEIDDRCSMIRFLLYANEFDVEGLIYSSSRYHWEGHSWEGTDWIERQIDAYEQVYDSLTDHDETYPSPGTLRDRIYVGNVDDVGAMDEDTPGSDRIVEVLLDDQPGPVYLQAWGGSNTIARALLTIQQEHPDRMDDVSEKAVIYIILNQDTTLREYIQPNWPELQVLNSFKQFRVFAYHWADHIPATERRFLEGEWMAEHVVEDHGPLCAAYPTTRLDEERYSDSIAHLFEDGKYFISEGDSPSYIHQIRTGLGSLAHPSYGGWGGRFEREPGSRNVWIGAEDDGDLYKPIWRWIPDLQRDWAARADWCVNGYDEANHPPDVVVNGIGGQEVVRLEAQPGSTLELDASGTSDPDGDALSYHWWQYPEPGDRSPSDLSIADERGEHTAVDVAPDAGDGTAHVILTVADDGEPELRSYKRVIVDVS